MTAAEKSAQDDTIARARAGDAAALERLRALVQSDPSRAKPHEFMVCQNVLGDSLAHQPRTRRDLWREAPKFLHRLAVGVSFSGAEQALSWVDKLPSLRAQFERGALARLAELEHQLLVDERLDRSGRSRIHKEIGALMAPGRSVWANWVQGTPLEDLGRFDRMVSAWLDAPADMRESDYFPPGWRERQCPVKYASDFFAQLPLPVLQFMGIKFKESKEAKGDSRFATLEESVELANERVALLQLKFRFSATEAASSAGTDASNKAKAAPTAPTAGAA
jgi:hypothetical protein